MSKVTINNFSGNLSTDTRESSTINFAMSRNFNLLTHFDSLVPFTGMTGMTATNFFINDFIYINGGTGISDNILGYGVQSGQGSSGRPELYKISDALPGTSWTTALTATGTASLTRGINNNLFHLYKGYVYFGVGGGAISRIGNLETSGASATWTESWNTSFSFTSLTQATTHPKDDTMYFGYNNGTTACGIAKYDGSSFSLPLALPTNMTVTSVTPYGNYLAIAVKPTSGFGNSYVYLWDRDSSLVTLSDSIDFGNGALNVLETINGVLVGVSIIGNSVFDLIPRVVVQGYTGGEPQMINTITCDGTNISLSTKKYKQQNILYFGANMQLNGIQRFGIWACGKNEKEKYIVTGDILVNNDTEPTIIDGFAKFNDVWYIAYNGGSVNRSLTDGSYAGTSIYETLINHGMSIGDRSSHKQLVSVQLNYEKLLPNGQIVLKYRVDGGSYSTIFTDNTDNSTFTTMNVCSDGTQFTSGYEYEFKIESSGGAVPTSLAYNYRVNDTNIDAK